MWDYWFEVIVIFMQLGISGRIYFMGRKLKHFHDCFHIFAERVFSQDDEVHVGDGKNMRIMGLEDFIDEFGFDPRVEKPAEENKANSAEIESWDNS